MFVVYIWKLNFEGIVFDVRLIVIKLVVILIIMVLLFNIIVCLVVKFLDSYFKGLIKMKKCKEVKSVV